MTRPSSPSAAGETSAKVLTSEWLINDGSDRVNLTERDIKTLRARIAAALSAASEEAERKRTEECAKVIEFGEYLAKSAEFYMRVTGEDPETDPDIRTDAWVGLRSSIYEFRKRAARWPPAPRPVEASKPEEKA